jgi:hypothetical protein
MSSGIIKVRTSERTAFRRCRWAWDRSFNQELRQRREAPVLRFGSLVHEALAAYYKLGSARGPHPAVTFALLYDREVARAGEFYVKSDEGDIDEKWTDARDLGIDLLEMYIEHYGPDRDWKVLAVEQPFKVPVNNPRTGRLLFYYVGILDLVLRQRSTNRVWIWDHKTCASIKDQLNGLGLNEQFGSYWAFGTQWLKQKKIIKPSDYNDLSGLMVNFLRRARRDTRAEDDEGRKLNKDGTLSKRQPPAIFHREATFRTEYDREQVIRRALNDYREMQMVRNGRLPVSKQPSPWHCKGCGWLDVCELHETGHDWQHMLDATTDRWNPYSQHEVEDDEKR